MKHRKPRPDNKKSAPLWMVTFSDLVTLILVFFILLFSMSQIDMVKFKALADSFRERQILEFYPSIIKTENPPTQPDIQSNTDQNQDGKDDLDNLVEEVQNYLEVNELSDVAVATRTERGVVLVLQEQVLFASGEATILPQAYAFMDKVGELLTSIPNMVKVEGHTDNRPISTSRYPSNWELSSARSSSVIRFLLEQHGLEPERFIAVGYGDTRPIVPNTTEENWLKNRRVELIISDPSYESITEPGQ
ncbi:flagellar motor protein MotS [Mangrovibacillus cuniculi]|uniref:Flagellar motor protein MotB n=1 Tax=Mangrovibacillus cuniculi TaxID=2593652 RepID=A0A7S8HGB1_9BACI|nr:flagellar motor protein MotS [Mangrovibacillus cuniculi]QPC47255.1 flagellar motor protein MotB [Mangrovibacillus cuniculi]